MIDWLRFWSWVGRPRVAFGVDWTPSLVMIAVNAPGLLWFAWLLWGGGR